MTTAPTNSIVQVATALAALAPLASGLVVERASASWAMVFIAAALAAAQRGSAAALAAALPLALLFPATAEQV